MDNDKQIRKIPNYSLEDIKKYSETLKRGLEDLKDNELTKTLKDFLEQLRVSEGVRTESMHQIWLTFKGKTNDEDILKAKALSLALVIVQIVRQNTEEFIKLYNNDNSISLGELFIEIASIFLLFIDRVAFSLLGEKNRAFFMDNLDEEFVALSLKANYKENADLMFDPFYSDLSKRFDEYSKLPFVQEINNSPKGTQLWEFAKNVAKILGKEKDVFIIIFVQLLILSDFATLQLNELLIGSQTL